MASVEDFIEAGLYDPDADAEPGRLDLLRWLETFGFGIDDLVSALERNALGSVAGDRRLVSGERLSRAAATDLASMSSDELDERISAFGLLPVNGSPPGEVGLTAAEVAAIAEFHLLGAMFTTEEATGLLRVIGASVSRIAEAAVSLFLADVESESIAAGESEYELAKKVYAGVGLLDGFAQRLDPILRRHVLQAIERTRRTSINEYDRFQYRYAVGFVDLVGFTTISAEMAPRELAVFLREFEARAYDVALHVRAGRATHGERLHRPGGRALPRELTATVATSAAQPNVATALPDLQVCDTLHVRRGGWGSTEGG